MVCDKGNWKDQLTKYRNLELTYDAIGNVTGFNGWTYEWQAGRQLKKMTYQSGTTVEYKYNAEGLRVQKSELKAGTNEKVITNYTLHGKLITHLTKGSEKLHFVYDAQSRPALVQHKGVWYGYVHNLQGDIIAIVDANGTQVVEYKYDACGRKLSVTGTKASTLGALNPFRYRGYIFDEETYHYYLRSRYYNPAVGRFIGCDITKEFPTCQGATRLSTIAWISSGETL